MGVIRVRKTPHAAFPFPGNPAAGSRAGSPLAGIYDLTRRTITAPFGQAFATSHDWPRYVTPTVRLVEGQTYSYTRLL
jgi:hypothetical protein